MRSNYSYEKFEKNTGQQKSAIAYNDLYPN
jgi:hypothetical protein